MTDLEKAIRAASKLETILRKKYRADGIGLGSRLRSVQANLKPDVFQQVEYIAHVRNIMAHNNVNRFAALGQTDEKQFYETCASLETFFGEKIFKDDAEANPIWIESFSIGWWPTPMASSREKRLFYYTAGDIRVCPPGTHKLTTLRGITEAGHVCMTPQSLPQMEVEPLKSKDKLSFLGIFTMSVVVADAPEKIRLVIIDADQQLETLRKQVVLCLQRICVGKDYDDLVHSPHEIAAELKDAVNSKVKSDEAASFLINECVIVECQLEDNEIEVMRRGHLRAAEETRKKEDELKRLAGIERLQLQTMKEKAELENRLALELKRHELDVFNLKAEADTAMIRKKAELELELAVTASQQEVEIQKNKAKADIEALNVVRAKAEIAASPAGKHALYPDDSFDVEKRRMNLEFEFWKAKFSDRKMQQILDVVAAAGLNQTQLQSLREALGQQLNVAITERPLALQESTDGKPTTPSATPPPTSSSPPSTTAG